MEIKLLGIKISNFTKQEVMDKIIEYLDSNNNHHIITINSMIHLKTIFSKKYRKIINEADLVICDSIGVQLAMFFSGCKLKERIPGIDLSRSIMNYAEKEKKSLYLLGGRQNITIATEKNIRNTFKNLHIVGRYHGYFKKSEEESIVTGIRKSSADIVFVAMGAPKQEKFINNNKDLINSKVMMGIGGTFDVFAGKKKRAPLFLRKVGFEWFYRIIKTPKKWHQFFCLLFYFIIVLFNGLFTLTKKLFKKGDKK